MAATNQDRPAPTKNTNTQKKKSHSQNKTDPTTHLIIHSPGCQIHSYNKHEFAATLFKNHCQERRCIQSTAASTFTLVLLNIRSLRAFQITHTKANQTLENPFQIFYCSHSLPTIRKTLTPPREAQPPHQAND
jgi:hypothetical protein